MLRKNGPLLIAANHPSSFLDAVILATLFKKPIYSLARGDAFKGKFISKILSSFNMLPVYRISEGAENLGHNYSTFDACLKIFKENGIVLIFSEGRCINEWHLRPLKKGTARLAMAAWQQQIPLEILPLGINYSAFKKFGKTVILNFGNIITKEELNHSQAGKSINEFNEILRSQLKDLVYEIEKNDNELKKKYFGSNNNFFKKILLFIPAVIGFVVHLPLYYSIDYFIREKATDHYDSIMTGLLFFIYPVYVLTIALIAFLITHNFISFFLLLLIPATALSIVHFKKN